MNDITYRPKKSLREVLPLRHSGRDHLDDLVINPDSNPIRRRRGWWTSALLIIALITAAVLGFSNLFGQASVTISPRVAIVNPSGTFAANRTGEETGLVFQLIDGVSASSSMVIPSLGQETVSTKARGRIIIYNRAQTGGQRLVATTRFQAPNGKIFRLDEAVVVPGYVKRNGEIIPGSTEATVTADQPGADFNLGLVDWTVPGFRGTPQEGKIYARSKTSMTGGGAGARPKVDPARMIEAEASLGKNLKAETLRQARALLPSGFVLTEGAIQITTTTASLTTLNENQAQISLTATLRGITFDSAALAQVLARSYVENYAHEPVVLTEPEKLKLTVVTPPVDNWPNDLASLQTINFTLTGPLKLVWVVPVEEIKKKLAGQAKTAYQSLLQSYPSINQATAIIRPPWQQHFPTDPKDIKLNVDLDVKL